MAFKPVAGSTQHPLRRLITIPLFRKGTRNPYGEVCLHRDFAWNFLDDHGNRAASPKLQDMIKVYVHNQQGQQVLWAEIPSSHLFAEVDDVAISTIATSPIDDRI